MARVLNQGLAAPRATVQ